MLLIYSAKDSPRLHYIAKILFAVILGIEYEIVIVSDGFNPVKIKSPGKPALLYGVNEPDMISIPDDGLLFEDDIQEKEVRVENGDIHKLRFSDRKIEGFSIDFDIFSSAFYLITQYKYYHSSSYDLHGRYDERMDTGIRPYGKPVIDIYADYLWGLLKIRYPDIQRKGNLFDYQITFDIDAPYLYKHKGLFLSLASLFKNVVKFRLSSALQQVKALAGSKDPYDVYDYIINQVPVQKLLFFFLINRNSHHDGRHTFKNKAYRQLIKKISDAGIQAGIHPSYNSFMDHDMIESETCELGKIIEKPVKSSRMHFLKYRLPDTFNYLQQAGIENDYTLCPINDAGYKSYVSRPYHWFDLDRNQETNLIIHPTMVMDRSLQRYMRLKPESALDEIKRMIDLTYKYNGLFTILFHNNSLSETGEWKGWKMVFENTILYLSAKKSKT